MSNVHHDKKSPLGYVTKAFGNLLHVRFNDPIRQGAIAMVQLDQKQLKAEVIEINGNEAKIQVFEDTRGIHVNTPVIFYNELLEAELGPGLLSSIVDGLQNPLQELSEKAGYFLPRGIYLQPLDRKKLWSYLPIASIGQKVKRGDVLGETQEGRFRHLIMVPFALYGEFEVIETTLPGQYTVDHIVAKIRKPDGTIIEVSMVQKWPIKMPLNEGSRVIPTELLTTGCRIIDTQFPVMKGGTFCTPGPFGAGKTMLQHHLSKYSAVDIVVIAACGERAGEVVEVLREFPHLTDPYTNEPLITRTVIICNTSSMPVAARESSVYLGITIAEYYRQMGYQVLLLADSTSRWAQALREMSGRLEEIPGEEAFPAYLASRIAEFYERAGVIKLNNQTLGSVTIGGSVSPAGGNFEEPVTQSTLAVVGAFLGLAKARSDARRYPAIDPLLSWSKYVQSVGKALDKKVPNWSQIVSKMKRILHKGDEIEKRMEVIGEEGTPLEDILVYLKAELYDFCYLQQNFFDKEDVYSPLDRQIALAQLIFSIIEAKFDFEDHDTARKFFLSLQSAIKNMNFLPFNSPEYHHALEKISGMIQGANQKKEELLK